MLLWWQVYQKLHYNKIYLVQQYINKLGLTKCALLMKNRSLMTDYDYSNSPLSQKGSTIRITLLIDFCWKQTTNCRRIIPFYMCRTIRRHVEWIIDIQQTLPPKQSHIHWSIHKLLNTDASTYITENADTYTTAHTWQWKILVHTYTT